MLAIMLNQVILLAIFHVSNCQRRITDGKPVELSKKYVVYLVKSATSTKYYDGWMCGGAIVSPDYIVTSAACVTDVEHLYAIAGYNVYVPDEKINEDECTKAKKKKIVLICTPNTYELTYEALEKWSLIDIAVVKVESPYNFDDEDYGCSYTPQKIKINYETKYQEPGIDAIVFGWGHLQKWRSQMDFENYNQPVLQYAPTLIQTKSECKAQYEEHDGMAAVIDGFMICTYEQGNINTAGDTIIINKHKANGCAQEPTLLKSLKSPDDECDNPDYKVAKKKSKTAHSPDITYEKDTSSDIFYARKKGDVANKTQISNDIDNEISRNLVDTNNNYNNSKFNELDKAYTLSNGSLRTRRYGICQNDHGGPLVTWVGAHEVLIGVASVFKITEDDLCTGPYLYTSTQCNGAFLDCITTSNELNTDAKRRAICNSPASEKGFDIVERHISWKNHPDGPADNEKNSTVTEQSTANSTNNVTSTNITTTNQIKNDKEKTQEEINNNHTLNIINMTNLDEMNVSITKEKIYNLNTNLTSTTISDIFNVTSSYFNNSESQITNNSTTKHDINSEQDRTKGESNYNFTTVKDLIDVTIANLNTTKTTAFINILNTTTSGSSKFTTNTHTSTGTITTTLSMMNTTTASPTSFNQTNISTTIFTNTTDTNPTTRSIPTQKI